MITTISAFISDYSVFIALLLLLLIVLGVWKLLLKEKRGNISADALVVSSEILGQARTRAIQTVQEADFQAVRTIEEADRRALAIVDQADKKASEMIKAVTVSSDEIRKRLDASLQEVIEKEISRLAVVADELLTAYRRKADDAQSAYVRTLEVASNTITGDAREGIMKFQLFLNDEMIRQQNLLTQFIQDRRDGAQQDVENYKRNVLKKIDDAIFGVLLLVAKDVLGKTLDTEEHQTLITHALDLAKKENFFTL